MFVNAFHETDIDQNTVYSGHNSQWVPSEQTIIFDHEFSIKSLDIVD